MRGAVLHVRCSEGAPSRGKQLHYKVGRRTRTWAAKFSSALRDKAAAAAAAAAQREREI